MTFQPHLRTLCFFLDTHHFSEPFMCLDPSHLRAFAHATLSGVLFFSPSFFLNPSSPLCLYFPRKPSWLPDWLQVLSLSPVLCPQPPINPSAYNYLCMMIWLIFYQTLCSVRAEIYFMQLHTLSPQSWSQQLEWGWNSILSVEWINTNWPQLWSQSQFPFMCLLSKKSKKITKCFSSWRHRIGYPILWVVWWRCCWY